MKKTIISLAMSSCFILGTSLAHADSDSSQGKMDDKMFKMDVQTFKAMDKDSDGRVTKHEFKANRKNKFDEMDFHVLDVDGNDVITPKEVQIVNNRLNKGGRNSSDSSGGEGNMDETWDQLHDDAWHKHPDSTWDKKRDDVWHHKSDNTSSGGTREGTHSGRTSSGGSSSQGRGGASGGSSSGGSESGSSGGGH